MTVQWWAMPTAGEIVWCHFAADGAPAVKPRPCLILEVDGADAPEYQVKVVYGTSQRVTDLRRGEFAIRASGNPAGYTLAGLSYDTKFDMKQEVYLPYNSDWFDVPPAAPYGQTPKLGTLHPSLMPAAAAAHAAAHGTP